MPKRWIKFPDNVVITDPESGKNVQTITFGEFLKKLMFNPLWNEGYVQAQAQDSIMRSYESEMRSTCSPGMWVAEEDWKYLEQTARHPRQMLLGPTGVTVQPGFGYHPSISRQLLPMQRAVIEAMTELEKERYDVRPAQEASA